VRSDRVCPLGCFFSRSPSLDFVLLVFVHPLPPPSPPSPQCRRCTLRVFATRPCDDHHGPLRARHGHPHATLCEPCPGCLQRLPWRRRGSSRTPQRTRAPSASCAFSIDRQRGWQSHHSSGKQIYTRITPQVAWTRLMFPSSLAFCCLKVLLAPPAFAVLWSFCSHYSSPSPLSPFIVHSVRPFPSLLPLWYHGCASPLLAFASCSPHIRFSFFTPRLARLRLGCHLDARFCLLPAAARRPPSLCLRLRAAPIPARSPPLARHPAHCHAPRRPVPARSRSVSHCRRPSRRRHGGRGPSACRPGPGIRLHGSAEAARGDGTLLRGTAACHGTGRGSSRGNAARRRGWAGQRAVARRGRSSVRGGKRGRLCPFLASASRTYRRASRP